MAADSFDVSLGVYRGPLEVVLAALDQPVFDGALLELDGDPSEELLAFAEELTADNPGLREQTEAAKHGTWRIGPIMFGRKPLLLPIRPGVIDRLRAMCERHAEPEIAIELRVLDSQGELLSAPDVGDNEIWVSRRLDTQAIAAVRDALSAHLHPE